MGLAAGLSGSAQAQTPSPATPQACAALQSDAARLRCYDNALGRIPAEPQAADNTSPPGDAPEDAGRGSLLDGRWELAADSKLGVFHPRSYKPVYLAPVSWTSDRNTTPHTPNPETTVTRPQDIDSVEARFQLSLKAKLAENLFGRNGDVWAAYTQNSRWQVYNAENSRPFRETNYEPELLLVVRTGYSLLGWRGRMAGVAFNHQSNGQGTPLSRSWNRVMLLIGLDRDNWALVLRPWRRLDEDSNDDNPDIGDYLGRGDLLLVHVRKQHQFSLTARHSLHGGHRSHGAVQFEWAFPVHGSLRGRLQLFHGYGESMIDYNHKATRASLGVSLLEWF